MSTFSGYKDGGGEEVSANALEMLLVGTPVRKVGLCRTSDICWGGRMTAAAAEASTVAR